MKTISAGFGVVVVCRNYAVKNVLNIMKKEAVKKIAGLVEKFRQNADAYRSCAGSDL